MHAEGWQTYRLGDLFENRRERGREGLPLLSVTMRDGLVDRDDLDRKHDSALLAQDYLSVHPNDIAYNTMRMWQGAFGLADRRGLVSPAYVVLKPKKGIDPAFAVQLLSTARMINLMRAYSYGLTDDRLRLYYDDFASIKVTIPAVEAQRKIASLLGAWDRAIGLKQVSADKVELEREALLQELITASATTRRDPAPTPFGELIASLDAGVSVNGEERAAGRDEVGVLKISAVTSGAFDPSENKAVRPEEVHLARVSPRAGRVLISRCNTAELLGASVYVEADHPSLFLPDKLWQVEPKNPKRLHMRWLAYWLAARATRAKISALATGSSGSMKNISKAHLLALPIPVPAYEEQKRVASALGKWDAAARNLRLQANLLRKEKEVVARRLLFADCMTRPLAAMVVP